MLRFFGTVIPLTYPTNVKIISVFANLPAAFAKSLILRGFTTIVNAIAALAIFGSEVIRNKKLTHWMHDVTPRII